MIFIMFFLEKKRETGIIPKMAKVYTARAPAAAAAAVDLRAHNRIITMQGGVGFFRYIKNLRRST